LATIAGGRNQNKGAERLLGKKRVGFLAIYFAGGRAKKKKATRRFIPKIDA
jgi:hypothetical protein